MKNKKSFIGIILFFIIILSGTIILYTKGKISNPQKVKATDINNNNEDRKADEVAKTIIEMNYEPITSLRKDDKEKGYVVIDAKKEGLDKYLDEIIGKADELQIKVTFINNEEILDNNKEYYKKIQKSGHTVLPSYINIREIFDNNNIKIIDNETDFNEIEKQDIAFYINIDDSSLEYKERLVDNINELQNRGYRFKAFV